MSKLKAVLDSMDGVGDAFHDLYTERDGKFYLTGIEGVKTQADIDRLSRSLSQEREAHKATKDKYKPLDDFLDDIPVAVERLSKYEEIEAAAKGKLDDKAIDGIVESRIKSKLTPIEREKKTLAERNALLEQENSELKNRDRRRLIHDAVRREAIASKMIETAVEDALLMAERSFEVNEEGDVVTKEGVSPKDWLIDMQPKRPHWWPASQGAGGRGSGGGSGLTDNPWTADNWNLTRQSQIYREDAAKADRMAKAAGSTVGAARPTVKK